MGKKLKDIKGLLPENCHLDWYGFEEVANKEIELDVAKIEETLISNGVYGSVKTAKDLAQAIAKEFPIKVKEKQ